MTRRSLLVLAALPVILNLPGCIFVSTNRDYTASKRLREQTREVDPALGPPTFRSEHQEQLSRITPGMSVEQFKGVFPSAVFVEQYQDDNRTVDVYSVAMSVVYHYREGAVVHTADEEASFYFHEGKLLRWREKGQG